MVRRRKKPPPEEPIRRGVVELVTGRRHLERVVQEGIRRARADLALATADLKAMLVPGPRGGRARSLLALLRELAEGGVEIRLLHSGIPSRAALEELEAPLPTRMQLRRCVRVHTKAVIVDASKMYVGSANLTGAGLGAKGESRRNFEAGIWTEDPELIDPILEWFDHLWEGRLCTGCDRRNVCPEPILTDLG